MRKAYPNFKRFQSNKLYKKLPKAEKAEIETYIKYRVARGLTSDRKVSDLRRVLVQFRYVFQKNLKLLTLKSLREMLALINKSNLSDHSKNDIKSNLKNYIKWKFKDWSAKFGELNDFVYASNIVNKDRKVTPDNIIKKKDIEKLMKHETKMFWKAFLITQYEAGLRTIEARTLKWDKIKLNSDGDISEIHIFATKTKRDRPVFVKEASFYLQKLKEEQENAGIKSPYVFPAPKDVNDPVSKGTVGYWFHNLSKKALGRKCWSYLLRHSRATELYTLAKKGKISKDTATEFMGHSEDMSTIYTHLDTKEIKEIIKSQVYKLEELPPEKKAEFTKEITDLKEIVGIQNKIIKALEKKQKYDQDNIQILNKTFNMFKEDFGKLKKDIPKNMKRIKK